MTDRDRAELQILRTYVVLTSLLLLTLTVGAFTRQPPTRFGEIDVERINVVEKDGRTRLVLSGADRSPGIVQRGDTLTKGGGRAGMLFYNDEGTENGGLIFSGATIDGKVSAVGSLTFDQYETDQTIALQYVESNGARRSGLAISDYPAISTKDMIERGRRVSAMRDGPEKQEARRQLTAQRGKLRVYVGRSRDDGAALVQLSDAAGHSRLQMRVDSLGDARIEFLNDSGRVVRRIPE